jgi:hypothetical protein
LTRRNIPKPPPTRPAIEEGNNISWEAEETGALEVEFETPGAAEEGMGPGVGVGEGTEVDEFETPGAAEEGMGPGVGVGEGTEVDEHVNFTYLDGLPKLPSNTQTPVARPRPGK